MNTRLEEIVSVLDEDERRERDASAWTICPDCSGAGHHALHGIAISADEWNHDWDEDEQEAYLRGDYDTTCETCGGRSTVKKFDLDLIHEIYQDEKLRRAEDGIYY